jgi:hypothetical protein
MMHVSLDGGRRCCPFVIIRIIIVGTLYLRLVRLPLYWRKRRRRGVKRKRWLAIWLWRMKVQVIIQQLGDNSSSSSDRGRHHKQPRIIHAYKHVTQIDVATLPSI